MLLKAVRHFKDALLLRPPRNSFERSSDEYGRSVFLILYELKTRWLWEFLQSLLSYVFLFQTFFEPQTFAQTIDDSYEEIIFIIETIVLIFCFIDSSLGLFLLKSSMD